MTGPPITGPTTTGLPTRRPGIVVASLLLAVVGLTGLGAKNQLRPYDVALHVVWGDPVGPESWREDLERSVANEIAGRGCFEAVLRHDPDADAPPPLVLQVVIDDYEERSRFGVGISTLQAPDAPPEAAQTHVAEIRALFDVSLRLPEGKAVRTKRFADRVTHRPVMNEDPRFEVRSRMLESVRNTVAKFVCKGSARKFEQELAAARSR